MRSLEIDTSSLIENVDVSKHLERNRDNINIPFEKQSVEFNPDFERTRRNFDQSGLRGLLLNNIKMDNNMELSLNVPRKEKPQNFYK